MNNPETELQRKRNLMLQVMLETYLKRNGKGTIKEVFNETPFQPGVLTNQQEVMLHFYLMDEYKQAGLNLPEIIEKTGETIIPGKLSDYEKKELVRRADDLAMSYGIIENYKKM